MAASLLHDLGHLLIERSDAELGPDMMIITSYRRSRSPRRYLVPRRSRHRDALLASKRSLELQGGIYGTEEAGRFIAKPFAQAAARLRGTIRQDPRQGHAVAH